MPNFGLSSARAEASRRNGAKSRGPKTPEGKARSSQNALKHGLRGQKHMLLPGESAAEYQRLEAALLEELAPEGALQAVLARASSPPLGGSSASSEIETEVFAWNQLGGSGHSLGLALIRDCNNARAFDTLLRYRGGTLAEFWRALKTLSPSRPSGRRRKPRLRRRLPPTSPPRVSPPRARNNRTSSEYPAPRLGGA